MHQVARTLAWSLLCLVGTALVAADVPKDSLDEVKKNLAENKAVLLDVREESEWKQGHLKQAHLLPLSKIKAGADPKDTVKDLKKDTIIYCHCKAGKRAVEAANLLKKKGYDVRGLKAGFDDLLKGGLEKSDK
jgi:rhodanese-related sulfurtransferase